jgi:hypothetical protein
MKTSLRSAVIPSPQRRSRPRVKDRPNPKARPSGQHPRRQFLRLAVGAAVKDKFENYLHREVCAGRVPITVARQEIATDWLKYCLAWQGDTSSLPLTSSTMQNNSFSTAATFAEYGIDWSLRSGYEVDHIISLALGGSNEMSNLYPESCSIQYGARVKDKFDNYLHREVCAGRVPITVAQQGIATDWLRYYFAWQGDTSSLPLTSSTMQNNSSSTAATSSAEIYYTSSYGSAKIFYPASCGVWKGLSTSYLMSFSSLKALLAKYPNRTLSPQC